MSTRPANIESEELTSCFPESSRVDRQVEPSTEEATHNVIEEAFREVLAHPEELEGFQREHLSPRNQEPGKYTLLVGVQYELGAIERKQRGSAV